MDEEHQTSLIAISVLFILSLLSLLFMLTFLHDAYPHYDGDSSYFYDTCSGDCYNNPEVSCYRYPVLGLIGKPLTIFGKEHFLHIFTFLIFFIPAVLLWIKTKNLILPLLYIVCSFPAQMSFGHYAQFVCLVAIMTILLFEKTKVFLYALAIYSHKMGLILSAFILSLHFGGKYLTSKKLTIPLCIIFLLLVFVVMLNLRPIFSNPPPITDLTYFSIVTIPLLIFSIHTQDSRLRNSALLTYCILMTFALSVYYVLEGLPRAKFCDFNRIIISMELFALIFLAMGKPKKKRITFLLCYIAILHFALYLFYYLMVNGLT